MSNNKSILVIGAGVSGLSSAILLLKAGFNVTIWTKDTSPNVTSDIAAAIWYPYLSEPRDKVIKWSQDTFRYLKQNIVGDPQTGCREEVLINLFDKKVEDPWWKDAVDGFKRPSPHELPPGYVDGYKITSILTDPTIYLGWLRQQFEDLGGTLVQKEISKIAEAFAEFDTVVNCSGLGSRELFGDKEVYPVRGQVVRVKPNGLNYAMADDSGHNNLAYVVPRFNEIILGGTAQKDNWSLEEDPKDTANILRKAKELYPAFADAEIVSVAVGLRPARSAVRLEAQDFDNGKRVIHNYGHGGSGYTLSWGCAQEVLALVKSSNYDV